jgi:predicted DNA-binding transcriptional regulator YafY
VLRSLQTRGQGRPLAELAAEFEVSDRTIQRDLEVLQELGFPLEFEEDEAARRFWRLPADYFRSGALVLSLTEAVSLHLAERFFTPLAGTHFAEGLHAIMHKVRAMLPERALAHFAELDEAFYVLRVGHVDYGEQRALIEQLSEAVLADRTVELAYRSLWRGVEYVTDYDPYGFVYHEGDLFLVGHSHRAAAVRVMKILRIARATLTPRTFERPADFDMETYFHSGFGIMRSDRPPTDVVVRFDPPVSELIEERTWHDSQKLRWMPDEPTLFADAEHAAGSLLLTFRLSELTEFKRWLRGFGASAEIVRPDWLRREFVEELAAALRRYDD